MKPLPVWDRQISAVAASSMRLKIATAPLPRSQEAMYCSATLTLLRRPASVMSPGVDARRPATFRRRRRRFAPTVELVGALPQHGGEDFVTQRYEVGVRHPGTVESVVRLALLVGADLCHRRGVDVRILAARYERRHPADRVGAPAVTGRHQQLRIRAHHRRRHRHLVPIWQEELLARLRNTLIMLNR